MTNDTSRPSAKDTTAPTATAAVGSLLRSPEKPPGIGWSASIRLLFWDARKRAWHLLGWHAFIPVEVWTRIKGPDGEDELAVYFDGEVCWLCPARR